MALTFSNIGSIGLQRQLSQAQGGLLVSTARLSSGMRVNTAADDASGIALSEKLRTHVRAISQAERNAQDGISMLQTADGSIAEISSMLSRMRELAQQAANGTAGTSDRATLNQDFQALRSEIDRLAGGAEFAGRVLLSGGVNGLEIQIGVGAGSSDRLAVTIADMRSSNLGSSTNLNAVTLTDVASARAAIAVVDAAMRDVFTQRSAIGAYENRLTATVTNLLAAREHMSAADSRIRDVDVAEESSALVRSRILTQAGVAVLSQANQDPAKALEMLR